MNWQRTAVQGRARWARPIPSNVRWTRPIPGNAKWTWSDSVGWTWSDHPGSEGVLWQGRWTWYTLSKWTWSGQRYGGACELARDRHSRMGEVGQANSGQCQVDLVRFRGVDLVRPSWL